MTAPVLRANGASRPVPYGGASAPSSPRHERITVVHIITRLDLGGAQQNTLATCEGLDRRRFRPILAYGPGGLLDAEASQLDLPRWPVGPLVHPVHPFNDVQAVRRLAELLRLAMAEHRALGLDPRHFIVHTHSSKAGVLGRLAAAAVKAPVVVHGIHGFGFHQGQHPAKFALFLNLERAAARLTHAFFSVSETNLLEARQRKIVQDRHFTRIVRSGMNIAELRPTEARRSRCRAELDLSPEAEVILSIANFKAQKDPLTLIQAFAHVARRRPQAVLLFAGDGPLRPKIVAAIDKERIQPQVRLLGWRRDIPDLLAACDVVALSSIFEGLPRSAVQSVAARRPFVGTQVDGTPEIIRDGKNGYLVPPRDPTALGDAIDRALRHRPLDPDDEERVKAWDVARMVKDQEDAYETLIAPSEAS